MKKRNKLTAKEKREYLTLALLALAGAGLSVLFILQYSLMSNTALTILSSILSFAYMAGSMLLLGKTGTPPVKNWKTAILFPLSYTVIVFLILLFLMQKQIPENPMRILDCLMWSIYSMPSFIIVIALIVLVLAAMAYA
ncbi:MAG: hypothetical protein IJW70_04865 [Clostridia bacterium]|nr:hypothetical protein [Clostridia bacterium]